MTSLLLAAACLLEPGRTPTPTLAWDYPEEVLVDTEKLDGFLLYQRIVGGSSAWEYRAELPCWLQSYSEAGSSWYLRCCPGVRTALKVRLYSPADYLPCELGAIPVQRYTFLEEVEVEFGVAAYRGLYESEIVYLGICLPEVCTRSEMPECSITEDP